MTAGPVIFFDLDGPILDVSPKYHRVYADLVAELGGTPLPLAEYWERKRARESDATILRDSGLPPARLEDFKARRRDRIEMPPYWRHDRVWPEMRPALASLAEHTALVLVTLRNNPVELRAELAALGLAPLLREVLSTSGDATGLNRHDAKVRLIRERFGEVPATWFIGDTETDLRAGAALGLRRAAVSFGIRTEEMLRREKPEKMFNHPRELAAWLEDHSSLLSS